MFGIIVRHLLKRADIIVGGSREWDIQVHNRRFYWYVLSRGSVGLGDSYMYGWWTCARVDLFISKLIKSGLPDRIPRLDGWILNIYQWLVDRQSFERSKIVAKKHYDVSPEFYTMVLGDSRIYTCARFINGVETLEAAQNEKIDLLCRKADLMPGQLVLDIGCGWGATLAYAAENFGVSGVGLSISGPQVDAANAKYRDLPVEYRVQDYRDFFAEVDAIISVCMIEHVGERHLHEYFSMSRDALASPYGKFALQCIVARDRSSMTDPWLDKHIFPGGELITKENLENGIRGMFHILDEEHFPEDYVRTLCMWCDNLRANRAHIIARYDEVFFRMYEYYFLLCAGAFMSGKISVAQFVLSPTVPDCYEVVR